VIFGIRKLDSLGIIRHYLDDFIRLAVLILSVVWQTHIHTRTAYTVLA